MEKPLAIAVRIYEGSGVFPYADIKTSLGSVETIVWTNINQREQFFYPTHVRIPPLLNERSE